MTQSDDWMIVAANERRRRLDAEHESGQVPEKIDLTTVTINLPVMRARFGKAAERITRRFSATVGMEQVLRCVHNPVGATEVTCAISPGAQLTIELTADPLAIYVQTLAPGRDIDYPDAKLAWHEGQLQLSVDGTVVSPEDAAVLLLKPFLVAASQM